MGIATILRLVPWGIALIGVAAAGFLFWKLGQTQEELGAAQMAAKTYAAALAAKAEATKSRNQTQQRVRQMPAAEKLKGLE
jgi:hypothetical protein